MGVSGKTCALRWTGDEQAILQVQFIGPGGIDYINPADDPRKKVAQRAGMSSAHTRKV